MTVFANLSSLHDLSEHHDQGTPLLPHHLKCVRVMVVCV